MLWHSSISAPFQFSIDTGAMRELIKAPTPRSEALNTGAMRELIKAPTPRLHPKTEIVTTHFFIVVIKRAGLETFRISTAVC